MRVHVATLFVLASLWAPPAWPQTADDLFNDDVLHDVWIHMNARDWAALRATYHENTYYPCDFEWRGMKAFNAGCRSRGSGSRSGIKPGLQVSFGYYVAGQEFLGLSSLVLDNLWQDPSMLKERLSMDLCRRMGLAAPREAHARVYVGARRDYAGLYGLVEDINAAFLRRQFGSDAGYLQEYRWKDEYHFENLGPDLEPYAARFEPRNHENESPFALYAPIRELIQVTSEASPSDLARLLAPHLDLPTFLAHLAVENFLSERDGLVGDWGLDNFYLYRPPEGRAARVIAWDKDYTFMWLEMPPSYNLDTNVLAGKAWRSPELRTVYLRKILESAALANWLEDEASRAYGQIRGAAREDPLKPVTNDEFERAVEDVTRFLQERGAIVRQLVAPLLTADH